MSEAPPEWVAEFTAATLELNGTPPREVPFFSADGTRIGTAIIDGSHVAARISEPTAAAQAPAAIAAGCAAVSIGGSVRPSGTVETRGAELIMPAERPLPPDPNCAPLCCGGPMRRAGFGGWICNGGAGAVDGKGCEVHQAPNGTRSPGQWWRETATERAQRAALPSVDQLCAPPGPADLAAFSAAADRLASLTEPPPIPPDTAADREPALVARILELEADLSKARRAIAFFTGSARPSADLETPSPEVAEVLAEIKATLAEPTYVLRDLGPERRIADLAAALAELFARVERTGGYASPEEQDVLHRARRVLAGGSPAPTAGVPENRPGLPGGAFNPQGCGDDGAGRAGAALPEPPDGGGR